MSTQTENTNTQPGEAKATEQTPPVQKAAVTGKALDWKLLGRVMHYVKPYNTTFIIAVFLTIFLAGVAIIHSKNRSNAGTSVPACGLYLSEVIY